MPCPYTKRKTDPYRIWLVPEHTLTNTNVDSAGHTTKATAEADANDVTTATSSKPKVADIQIKLEVTSPEELLVERREALLDRPDQGIRALQDIELTEQGWMSKYGNDPFKAPLAAAISKNATQIIKTVKLLKGINSGDIENTDKNNMAALIQLIDQNKDKHQFVTKWAVTYQIADFFRNAQKHHRERRPMDPTG